MKFPICGPLPAVMLSASIAALSIGVAVAEPAPPFPALLEQALSSAPRLAEASAEIGQAEGLARQAAARPNPVLGVDIENFAGSGPFQGFSDAETTASIEQTFELGGKRPARIAAGQAALAAARARATQGRVDFAVELAQVYAEAEASQVRVQLAVEALSLAGDDARVTGALVSAGKEADVRSVQARAAVQSAQAGLQEARSRAAAAFAKLTALAGASSPFTTIPVSLLRHAERAEAFANPDTLASPSYLSALANREAVARRVRVEQTRRTPDLTGSLGVRRLAGNDATALVGGVSIPLPVFDKNRGNVVAAQAELLGAEARLRNARLQALADAGSAVSRAEASQARISAAASGEAAAEEAYRLTRIGYEGGKLPLSEVLNARRALAEARNQTLEARLERLRAEAELARLQGAAPFGDQP